MLINLFVIYKPNYGIFIDKLKQLLYTIFESKIIRQG
jgi:hypothetical protein